MLLLPVRKKLNNAPLSVTKGEQAHGMELPLAARQYTDGRVSILHSIKQNSAMIVADVMNCDIDAAAHIVKCVNSHQELVAALERLVRVAGVELDRDNGRPDVMADMRAILAKVQ